MFIKFNNYSLIGLAVQNYKDAKLIEEYVGRRAKGTTVNQYLTSADEYIDSLAKRINNNGQKIEEMFKKIDSYSGKGYQRYTKTSIRESHKYFNNRIADFKKIIYVYVGCINVLMRIDERLIDERQELAQEVIELRAKVKSLETELKKADKNSSHMIGNLNHFKGLTDEMLVDLYNKNNGKISKIVKACKDEYDLEYSWAGIRKRLVSLGICEKSTKRVKI